MASVRRWLHAWRFRRCQAPYCRVSMARVVYPWEWRVAVPVWGRVHLACRPTGLQLAILTYVAAGRRAAAAITLHMFRMRTGMERAADAIRKLAPYVPEDDDDPDWEYGAQRVTFRDP